MKDVIKQEPPYRSRLAKRLHTQIMMLIHKTADITNPLLLPSLKKITSFLLKLTQTKLVSTLLETSINGFSHMQDIVHLSFECIKNKLIAEKQTLNLLQAMFNIIRTKLALTDSITLLTYTNKDGFTLLHSALLTKNIKLISFIFAKLENILGKDSIEFKNLLQAPTNTGFTILTDAVASTDIKIIKFIFNKLLNTLNQPSIQKLAYARTLKKFNLFHSASKTDSLDIVKLVKEYFDKIFDTSHIVETLLEQKNEYGFLPSVTDNQDIKKFLNDCRKKRVFPHTKHALQTRIRAMAV